MQQMTLFEDFENTSGASQRVDWPQPWTPIESAQPTVQDRGIPLGPIQMGPRSYGTNWGREEYADPTPADLGEIGATGLDLTPWGLARDAVRPELAGRNLRRLVKEMIDTDPVTGSMLYAVEMLVRQVIWQVMPAEGDDSDEGKAAAKFVESCLHDMNVSWADVLTEILTFLPYGWSFFELVYKVRGGNTDDPRTRSVRYDDGLIGWRKWAPRKQDSLEKWEFDPEGGISGMWQTAPPDYKPRYLPIEKSLLFRTRPNGGNPEGRSVLLNAVRPYKFKKRVEEFEAIGVERDLAGLPYMKVPRKLLSRNLTDPNDIALRDMLRQIITGVRRNEQEGLLLPSDMYEGTQTPMFEFSLVNSGGGRQYQTDQIIDRLKHDMATTLLCDWLLLGQNRVGSYALSSDKTDIFGVSLGTYLSIIMNVVNQHAIPRLFQFDVNAKKFPNAAKNPPRLAHKDIETMDLTVLGTFVGALKTAGVPLLPNRGLVNYLMEQANLPLPTEAEQKKQDDAAEQAKQQGAEGAAAAKAQAAATGTPSNAKKVAPTSAALQAAELLDLALALGDPNRADELVESSDPNRALVDIDPDEFHTPGGKGHNQKNHTRLGYIRNNLKLAANVDKKQVKKAQPGHGHFAKGTDVTGPKADLKPASPPKTKPTASAPTLDTANMKQIGGQGGSNPGAMYETKSGERYYIKYPHGDEATVKHKLANEITAGKLYEAAGIPVAKLSNATHQGRPAIASKVVDVDDLTVAQMKAKQDVRVGFATDAWLANWDVVGNGGAKEMNLKRNKETGKAMRLDTGGALLYRAQGGKKGDAFGDKVGEITTFRNPQHNSGKVFGGMTNKEIVASMDRVIAIKSDTIAKIVNQFGPGTAAEKASLLKTLLARQADIAKQRAKFANEFSGDGGGGGGKGPFSLFEPEAFHHPGGKPHNQKNHTRKGYLKSNPKLAGGLSGGTAAKWHKAQADAAASVEAQQKAANAAKPAPAVDDLTFAPAGAIVAPKDRKTFYEVQTRNAVAELMPAGVATVGMVESKSAGKGALAYFTPFKYVKGQGIVDGYIRIGPEVGKDLARVFDKKIATLTPEQAGLAVGAAKTVLHEWIHATSAKSQHLTLKDKIKDNAYYKHKPNHDLEEGFTELGARVMTREFIKRTGLTKLRPEMADAAPPNYYKSYPKETATAAAISSAIAFQGKRTFNKAAVDIAVHGTNKSRSNVVMEMWLRDSGVFDKLPARTRQATIDNYATKLRGALSSTGAVGQTTAVNALFHDLADAHGVPRHPIVTGGKVG